MTFLTCSGLEKRSVTGRFFPCDQDMAVYGHATGVIFEMRSPGILLSYPFLGGPDRFGWECSYRFGVEQQPALVDPGCGGLDKTTTTTTIRRPGRVCHAGRVGRAGRLPRPLRAGCLWSKAGSWTNGLEIDVPVSRGLDPAGLRQCPGRPRPDTLSPFQT